MSIENMVACTATYCQVVEKKIIYVIELKCFGSLAFWLKIVLK